MKYVGGKHKIGKQIVEQLLMLAPPDTMAGYVEPFVGACGVLKHITDKGYAKYQAYDKDEELIDMWKSVKNDSLALPKQITRDDYYRWKASPKSPERTAVGYGMSFGGKYFAGYSQDPDGLRDFLMELKNSHDKIRPKIQNVDFAPSDYSQLTPDGCLIYCDPPYQNTQGYRTGDFDDERFWDWAERMTDKNVVVVSSEFSPEGWIQVWQTHKFRSLQKAERRDATEKLWIYAPIWDF